MSVLAETKRRDLSRTIFHKYLSHLLHKHQLKLNQTGCLQAIFVSDYEQSLP